MAKDVKTTKPVSVVTTRSAVGTPLGTVDYPAGYEGKVPDGHYDAMVEAGALANPPPPSPPAPAGAGAGA